jgi:hypothetical protein
MGDRGELLMNQDTIPHEISKVRVVYTMPGSEAVRIQRGEAFGISDESSLDMDFYYPAHAKTGSRTPAVVFVTGFSDLGARQVFGCAMKEMGSYVSWARLVAASGMVAVTYTNREPAKDVYTVLQYVRDRAAILDIDADRLGLWACSGNAPAALSVLMESDAPVNVRCAVLPYGYMLDADGATDVADAAARFHFVNPCAGKTVEDLRRDVPLFLARAGQDQMPHLNEALDRFIGNGLACNLPLTIFNHSGGPHAFDLFHDSDTSREGVRLILQFLRFNLLELVRSTSNHV